MALHEEDNEDDQLNIGIFVDEVIYSLISDYFRYHSAYESRPSIEGVFDVFRLWASQTMGLPLSQCAIVEAHSVRPPRRGNITTPVAFATVMERAGVVAHHAPVGPNGERTANTIFALEALRCARDVPLHVAVLYTANGNLAPLVDYLDREDVLVVIPAADIQFDGGRGPKEVITSPLLLDSVAHTPPLLDLFDAAVKYCKEDPAFPYPFVTPTAIIGSSAPKTSDNAHVGIVTRWDPGSPYGFVKDTNLREWFVGVDQLLDGLTAPIPVNTAVVFRGSPHPEHGRGRPSAYSVRLYT
ncbi:hypothetical protein [Microbispora sp. NPDC049125]|uniref:hypothetical protein n=1 Tax=Microbispora sp. NPDC049125 TaxID=3154929 RepID=UPI003466F30A